MKTCTFCNDPSTCTLCMQLNGPARLTSKDLGAFGRDLKRNKTLPVAPGNVAAHDRVTLLRYEVEKAREENASLKARLAAMPPPRDAVTQLHAVTFDPSTAPTVPPPAVRVLAAAPAPTPPPSPYVQTQPATLAKGDWAGLAAWVEQGKLSQKQAEDIGAGWLAVLTPRAFA